MTDTTVELNAATIEVQDSGGSGPTVLFVHGLLVDGTLWRKVVTRLDGFRCVVPTLPLGSHRIPAVRRSPLAYGLLTKRPVPAEVLEGWVRPALRDRRVRGDVAYFTRHIDKRLTLDAAAKLSAFERPVLLAWSSEDRFFKTAFAERLATVFPLSRLEAVADAYTFLPEDQPGVLADLSAGFAAGPSAGGAPAGAEAVTGAT